VLERFAGFDWDIHNMGHIAVHDVLPDEVEEAVASRRIIIASKPKQGENRWKLYGRSRAGRFLVVVFTIRRNRFRTVTAYTMNQIERRIYAPQIEGTD
jgi:uncharacterized protein